MNQHPAITHRTDALLASINDRLGAIALALGAQAAGAPFAPLSLRWITEVMAIERAEREAQADWQRELERRANGG